VEPGLTPLHLQHAWDYNDLRKHLRWAGGASVAWGGLSLLLGLAALASLRIMGVVGIALGGMLLVEGVWILAAPSALGLIGEGIVLASLGAFNLAIQFIRAAHGDSGGSRVFWCVLGAFQIMWGLQAIGRYRRARPVMAVRPSEEAIGTAVAWVEHARRANPDEHPDVIKLSGLEGGKVALEQGLMVCGRAGQLATFAPPQGVIVTVLDQPQPGKDGKVELALPAGTVKGGITAEHLQRLQAWRAWHQVPAPGALPEPAPPPTPPPAAMPPDPLATFVRDARAQGMSDEQVLQALAAAGWPEGAARTALQVASAFPAP